MDPFIGGGQWFRPHDVRAEENNLVGIVETREFEDLYNPLEYPNLPNVFAKVRDATTAMRFVRLFGRLGYAELAGGDSLSEAASADLGVPIEYVEPIGWIADQARTARFVSELLVALRIGGPHECGEVMRRYSDAPIYVDATEPTRAESVGSFKVSRAATVEQWQPDVWVGETDDGEELAMPADFHAAHMAIDLINANTRGVDRALTFMDRIRESVTVSCLLAAIWWHVEQWALGGDLRLCRNCGTPFLVTHGRQEFCPGVNSRVDMGGRVVNDRSICGAVYRQRETRRQKAQEQALDQSSEERE